MTKFGLILKNFLIENCSIEIFFARNRFSTIRNGGIDTNILKIGPNLAVFGRFGAILYFLKCYLTLQSTWFFKENTKIVLKWPNLVRFSKCLCLYPHFWWRWIHFWQKKNSFRQFSIRKILKIRPNFVILGQFSYIMKCSYVGLSRGRQRKIKFFNWSYLIRYIWMVSTHF